MIISHIGDLDGITPVILSKLVYPSVEYILVEPDEVDKAFDSLLVDKRIDRYDEIILTDLAFSKATCDFIMNSPSLNNRVKVFDHHINKTYMLDYPFVTLIGEDKDGVKQSATSLFYQYLLDTTENEIIRKESVREFVNLVRLLDTWTFEEENNLDAKRLGDLFEINGYQYMIDYYTKRLPSITFFTFSPEEKYLLRMEDIRIKQYIDRKAKHIFTTYIDGYRVGVVFAESYRSELGNALAKKFIEHYDFFVIINMNGGISFRGGKDINLGEIAAKYEGGGHKKAAGAKLPDHIQEKLIEKIFRVHHVEEPEEMTFTQRIRGGENGN